jgi:hypothetical protein
MPKDKTIAAELTRIRKKRRQEERFIRTRMWFSTLLAGLYRDRGSIPANIGNNILIGNNTYITKNALSAVVRIVELSTDTPLAFTSELIRAVKSKVPDVIIDFTIKNRRQHFDVNSNDMKSRINNWKLTLEAPLVQDANKRRAARLLYTVDVARSGEQLYRTATFVIVRAKNGTQLNRGVDQVCSYLSSIGAAYKVVKSDLRTSLGMSLLMSDEWKSTHKDLTTNVMSRQTLAEILPDTQGMNDDRGTLMGIDRKMQGPYFINFRATAKAKNIIVCAPSGVGKTFLAQNWFMDMYASGYNMCIMDIKGTEFIGFTKAAGGVVLSMRPSSTYYINTWRLDKEEAGKDPRVYFDERFNLSKEIMMLLANLPETMISQGEALIEEFMQSLYLQLGITSENTNTWVRSGKLTPYDVFDHLARFCSTDIRNKYEGVAERLLTRLRIYMERNGSNSHMFRDSFNYKDILDTKVLTFDFGILEAGTSTDQAMFKVRVLYMQLLNDQYISHKYRKGEWTGKILEESGVASDYLIKLYAKEFMLRRAQNQVTILLGNSVSALARNPNATGILENVNILVLGALNKSSRVYLTEEFGLDKEYDELEELLRNPEYTNTFLLINKMGKDATTALLKAFVPDRVANGKLFRIVDTEN